ncbi:mitochondrial 2-enoyl thioester reductase [Savitreella phatthalungensis]
MHLLSRVLRSRGSSLSLSTTSSLRRRGITSRAIVFDRYGAPGDVLKVHEYETGEPRSDEFLVRFLASPINPADLNQIEGVYPTRPHFDPSLSDADPPLAVGGNEALCEIIKPGRDHLDMKWRLGEWCILKRPGFGTWRSHAVVKGDSLIGLSKVMGDGLTDGLDPVQVAVVGVNPCTAYRMLLDFSTLGKGDWWIQNGASSAVGRCAVQFSRLWGYRSINVIRERPGWEKTKAELEALGADVVITDTQLGDRDFVKENVKSAWRNQETGRGVSLALNCVSGINGMNLVKTLEDGGHHVTYGAMSKQPLKLAASPLIFRDIHFHGFWVSRWAAKNPEGKIDMLRDILTLVKDGKFAAPQPKLHWWDVATQSEEESLEIFKRALEESATGGKQVLCFA